MNIRGPRQSAQWNTRHLTATPRSVGMMTDRYAERAENVLFWDVEGRHYVDFTASTAVVSTGYHHPRLVQAVRGQPDHLTHTAFQIVPYGSYIELAERPNTITPGMHAEKTAFFTTNAETVENAIKIAQAHTGHPGVIILTDTFRGCTFMGTSLMGKMVPYKMGFGPFPGSIYYVSVPVALHGVSAQDAFGTIQRLFEANIDSRQVATIVFEPVQDGGNFYQVPADFMHAIRALCDEHGIVMIADKVQTGFTRTGKLFTMEHTDVPPDITTMVGGLADGLPLSAITGRAEIMNVPAPGGLGGTYAGNPLAVASVHAVLNIITGKKLCERSATLGVRLVDALNAAKTKQPRIAEVRDVGAMVAVEFSTPDGKPDADFTKLVQQRTLEAGLFSLSCGVYGSMIRFLFPLMIEDAVFEEGLAILQRALGG